MKNKNVKHLEITLTEKQKLTKEKERLGFLIQNWLKEASKTEYVNVKELKLVNLDGWFNFEELIDLISKV